MKLNKKMLKEIIREALNELEQAAPSAEAAAEETPDPSDVAKVKDLMVRTKITDQIEKLINTPQELLALINMLMQMPVHLKPQQKMAAMRAAAGELSTGGK